MHLDLTPYQDRLQIKREGDSRLVWDRVRRKYLTLTPEEMVRQLLLVFLVEEAGFNKNRIAVEQSIQIQDRQKRFDILVYDPQMRPFMLVECKAPSVKISQAVFDQIATYNMPLKVPFLLVSNGPESYCCAMDYENQSYTYLEALPAYPHREEL